MIKDVSKKWYMSKTFIAAVLALVLAVCSGLGVPIPEEVYVILASLGFVGLRTAKTKVENKVV